MSLPWFWPQLVTIRTSLMVEYVPRNPNSYVIMPQFSGQNQCLILQPIFPTHSHNFQPQLSLPSSGYFQKLPITPILQQMFIYLNYSTNFSLRSLINFLLFLQFLASSYLTNRIESSIVFIADFFSTNNFRCSRIFFISEMISSQIIFLASRREMFPFNLFFSDLISSYDT